MVWAPMPWESPSLNMEKLGKGTPLGPRGQRPRSWPITTLPHLQSTQVLDPLIHAVAEEPLSLPCFRNIQTRTAIYCSAHSETRFSDSFELCPSLGIPGCFPRWEGLWKHLADVTGLSWVGNVPHCIPDAVPPRSHSGNKCDLRSSKMSRCQPPYFSNVTTIMFSPSIIVRGTLALAQYSSRLQRVAWDSARCDPWSWACLDAVPSVAEDRTGRKQFFSNK